MAKGGSKRRKAAAPRKAGAKKAATKTPASEHPGPASPGSDDATHRREKRPTQAERIEAHRRARRRRTRLIRYGAITVLTLGLGGFVAWGVASRRAEQRAVAAMTSGDCRYDTRSDPGRVNQHAQNTSFELEPPSGGIHDGSAATAGAYSEENRPSDGQIVHALEHGFIALWYRPDIGDSLDALEAIREDFRGDVLLLPRPTLETPVAATAWHRRLLCEDVEEANLRRFVERYRNKGPERVPRNSAAAIVEGTP